MGDYTRNRNRTGGVTVTITEARDLVATYQAIWPTPELPESTVTVWARLLAPYERDAIEQALHRLASSWTGRMPPPIGALIRDATTARVAAPEWEAAWNEVLEACDAFGRYRIPRFGHPLIELAVRRIGWLAICDDAGEWQRNRFRDL